MFDDNRMQIKTIGKYRIELHTGTEQAEERSDCTVTCKFNGPLYGGSLHASEGDSGLYDDAENFIPVPESIIETIYAWAEKTGY